LKNVVIYNNSFVLKLNFKIQVQDFENYHWCEFIYYNGYVCVGLYIYKTHNSNNNNNNNNMK